MCALLYNMAQCSSAIAHDEGLIADSSRCTAWKKLVHGFASAESILLVNADKLQDLWHVCTAQRYGTVLISCCS